MNGIKIVTAATTRNGIKIVTAAINSNRIKIESWHMSIGTK